MCSDCTPVKWSKYFEKEQDVYVKDNTFHVYSVGESGPLLLMIHGGGYSALTWSLFAVGHIIVYFERKLITSYNTFRKK